MDLHIPSENPSVLVTRSLPNVHSMITWSKNGIGKPKMIFFAVYDVMTPDIEPFTNKKASKYKAWVDLTREEHDALLRNDT